MNRILVLLYEGAPVAFCITAGEVRECIARYEAEDVDLLQVFAVYHLDKQPAHDVSADYSEAIIALDPSFIPDALRHIA